MNISMTQLFEAAGILAVVISLLFVAYQIQQANLIARVTTEYEIRNNHAEFNQSIFTNPDIASFLGSKFDPPAESGMTQGEYVQGIAFAIRSINIWTAAETAFKNGMLSESTYNFMIDDIRYTLAADPGMRLFYRDTIAVFPSQSGMDVIKLATEIVAP
ncbi:MAG: hypothetical protein COB20_11145 [SAR86 cluster bacterium]|uniref:Uncharacterized protein n=1 Tax=SAR86 cluster bacterium TaxID=2030880 RepID=A0A2A4X173_9GAMM|nr:MAG: hypothetical protein COB20_11145 [SAR86 cluster bacterium]